MSIAAGVDKEEVGIINRYKYIHCMPMHHACIISTSLVTCNHNHSEDRCRRSSTTPFGGGIIIGPGVYTKSSLWLFQCKLSPQASFSNYNNIDVQCINSQ